MSFNPLIIGSIQESGAGFTPITASGGDTITTYTEGGVSYKSHKFNMVFICLYMVQFWLLACVIFV